MVSASRHVRRWGACAAGSLTAVCLFLPSPQSAIAASPKTEGAQSQYSRSIEDSSHPNITIDCTGNEPVSPEEGRGKDTNAASKGGPSDLGWWLDSPISIFTLGLFLVAILQLITFIYQVITARRQTRAYLFVEDARIQAPSERGSRDWKITYTVKNNGNTPAHKVSIVDIAKLESWRPPNLPIPIEKDYLGSLAPGGDFVDNEAEEIVGTIDIDAIQRGQQAIFLVGSIKYVDIFKSWHTTHFCFYAKGHISAAGEQMVAYDEGNDSD